MNRSATLHFLSEFAPVLAFFIAGQFFSFFTATAILVAFTIVALTLSWVSAKKVPVLPIAAGVFVVISGIITIRYQAPDALIFADSLYYVSFSIIISGGLLLRRNVLKMLFQATFAMYDRGWKILAERWAFLFLVAALANEFVRLNMSPEFWVDYKFAKVVVILAFGCYQFTLARRYRIPEESTSWGLRR